MAYSGTSVLLSVAEMGRADAMAVSAGVSEARLMEAAGAGVARETARRFPRMPVVVLCGPGNNGGDGFVAARALDAAGFDVRVALFGRREALKGAAAANAKRWKGPVEPMVPAVLDGAGLVIDAIFGAGLVRPLEGVPLATVSEIGRRALPVVAVDVPSGIDGDTGQIRGGAPAARLTVTFFRRKPGHLLLPGRTLCGETVVVDIGTPVQVLDEIRPQCFANSPPLWMEDFPWPRADDHKYSRGHAIIVGGAKMTGAARLAARAALRAGAGIVTIAAPAESIPIYAAYMPGVLTETIASANGFSALLADPRVSAALVGPGAGIGEATRALVLAALAAKRGCVLDADALTSFAEDPRALFSAEKPACIMTPHEGEFARLFGRTLDLTADKLSRARAAAKLTGAVMLIKGADTVIAGPDGRAVINADAPPELATAGAGDVLAGIATGLLTAGMPAFPAACAAAWLHGAAAAEIGPGLIAEDLEGAMPAVLRGLKLALGGG